MHYVYVLKSLKSTFLYIGETKDLKRRFSEHNSARVGFTSKHRPLKLVYYEAYNDSQDAIKREKMLKQYGASLAQLKKRLYHSLLK